MGRISNKEKMMKAFNETAFLRSRASIKEDEFCNLFEKVYGYEFEPSNYDGLVDVLQMGLGSMDLNEFESNLEFGNNKYRK